MPELRLENVSKLYKAEKKRKEYAVRDLSLTVTQGEFVFLIGSSGAGKSTMLKLMGGEISPDRGAVYLDGSLNVRQPPYAFENGPFIRAVFVFPLDRNGCSSYNNNRTKFLYGGFPMTGWTLFFTLLGAAILTAQLFRFIDLIERPARRSRKAVCLPAAWNVRLWASLSKKTWMSWRS